MILGKRLWCAVRSSVIRFWTRVQVTHPYSRLSITSVFRRTIRVNGASSISCSSRLNRLYHAHGRRIRHFISHKKSALASTRRPRQEKGTSSAYTSGPLLRRRAVRSGVPGWVCVSALSPFIPGHGEVFCCKIHCTLQTEELRTKVSRPCWLTSNKRSQFLVKNRNQPWIHGFSR